MKKMKKIFLISLLMIIFGIPVIALGAAISDDDSTQPRGAAVTGGVLDPIVDGFRAPARFDGDITPNEDSTNPYRDWLGSIMANATRDPAFFATLNVANQDLINLINSLGPADLAAFLEANILPADLDLVNDEDLLPVAADICLRCHSPVGWMEAHSEPPTPAFPFLDGQFWGAAFLEEPVDGFGDPKAFDISVESEAEMEGIQCDFCHRAYDNSTRDSYYDGSTMSAGDGGFFVELNNPFNGLDGNPGFGDHEIYQKSGNFCGTCHDVTNPLIKTNTTVNGAVPDMFHPIERTYTEWYWSGYRDSKQCQECHLPMQFRGAQTWLLYPGLDMLWGDVDQKWIDRGFDISTPKSIALMEGMNDNRNFMRIFNGNFRRYSSI